MHTRTRAHCRRSSRTEEKRHTERSGPETRTASKLAECRRSGLELVMTGWPRNAPPPSPMSHTSEPARRQGNAMRGNGRQTRTRACTTSGSGQRKRPRCVRKPVTRVQGLEEPPPRGVSSRVPIAAILAFSGAPLGCALREAPHRGA